MPDFGVALGSDNERHLLNMFGSTKCGAEDLADDPDEFELIDTGETDVTCEECLADE